MQNKPIEADFRYMPLFLRYSAFCMFYCQIMGQKIQVACGFLGLFGPLSTSDLSYIYYKFNTCYSIYSVE